MLSGLCTRMGPWGWCIIWSAHGRHSPVEYDWTIRSRRRCGLSLPLLWQLVSRPNSGGTILTKTIELYTIVWNGATVREIRVTAHRHAYCHHHPHFPVIGFRTSLSFISQPTTGLALCKLEISRILSSSSSSSSLSDNIHNWINSFSGAQSISVLKISW